MTEPFRFGTGNPFSGTSDNNPFTALPNLQLVTVPNAPETHERRAPRRNYLAGPGGGGDDLLAALAGRKGRTIERVKTIVKEVPADDAKYLP